MLGFLESRWVPKTGRQKKEFIQAWGGPIRPVWDGTMKNPTAGENRVVQVKTTVKIKEAMGLFLPINAEGEKGG